ncbi:MAG: 16S rRNA (guanine(966)-N(2))-methyltransferase RsmD [Spirulina sp.]
MRIYGNRQLKTMPGRSIRPTPARVREALFNIWQDEIVGCRWLDVCAGNGSLGAEALCRGASEAIALELRGRACQILRENWQQVARSPQEFQVIRGDARQTLKRLAGRQFDRIYFDPPYQSELYDPVLEIIAKEELLAPLGEMAVEYNPQFWTPDAIATFEIIRQKTYGSTALACMIHNPTE